MEQKYINGDVVMYDNKIMVVKEPRDGSHFDLSCPKEGLVYCFVSVDDIKPIPLTPEILEKNEWKKLYEKFFEKNVNNIRLTIEFSENIYVTINRIFIMEIHYIHELQHLLFGLELKHEMEV